MLPVVSPRLVSSDGGPLPVETSDWEKSAFFDPLKIEVKELRDNVINELLSTEQSYVRELHVLNIVCGLIIAVLTR